ncbi:MAG: hypothetical protein WD689_05135 [Gaiellaceae bacterium]
MFEEQAAVHAADVDAALRAVEGVERSHGIVRVEPEVAREVVPRPQGHDHERKVVLERRGRHRRERPVAARHAHDLHAVQVSVAELPHLDATIARGRGKLAGVVCT